jgi:uncharacterized surface protein with fasciclin (FAS1) repeats
MKYYLAAFALLLALAGCRDEQWNEHSRITESSATISLLDALRAKPECSAFVQALAVTGYDTLLAEANTYTVFAPDNSAWASVNMSNVESLKKVVANLISTDKRLEASFTAGPLLLINGKILSYDAGTRSFNGATVSLADNVAANGVFHVINKVVELRENVWDYIILSQDIRNLSHVLFLKDLSHREMDESKSVQVGVNAVGQPVYDTIWQDVNDFLKVAPLNDEAREWTYIVLEDGGFTTLYDKYLPYFKVVGDDAGGSRSSRATSISLCQDFIFEGRLDITELDSAVNIAGMKVPVKDAYIVRTYEASNGRVYVIDQSNIPLREKIRPIVIEGEAFTSTSDNNFVYARYKTWASGERDVILSCQTVQSDSVLALDSLGNVFKKVNGQDSMKLESVIHGTPSSADASRATLNNFHIELKAQVQSVSYEVHYVAFDDVSSYSSNAYHVLRIEQKLFMSLPGQPALKTGSADGTADAVGNGHRGDTICFVGINNAGNTAAGQAPELTRLSLWSLQPKTQFLKNQLVAAESSTVTVSQAGEMTLWLVNTTRRNTSRQQGMLFLDYVKLVPILPNE